VRRTRGICLRTAQPTSRSVPPNAYRRAAGVLKITLLLTRKQQINCTNFVTFPAKFCRPHCDNFCTQFLRRTRSELQRRRRTKETGIQIRIYNAEKTTARTMCRTVCLFTPPQAILVSIFKGGGDTFRKTAQNLPSINSNAFPLVSSVHHTPNYALKTCLRAVGEGSADTGTVCPGPRAPEGSAPPPEMVKTLHQSQEHFPLRFDHIHFLTN